MSDREMLLRRLSSAQFAAWEVRMYLDTHPDDTEAINTLHKYTQKTALLMKEFESKYGPIEAQNSLGDKRFQWVNNPWPWEVEAN